MGLDFLSDYLGTDLSNCNLDGPLPGNIPLTNGNQSRQKLIIDLAKRENLTIRQLYRKIAGSGHTGLSLVHQRKLPTKNGLKTMRRTVLISCSLISREALEILPILLFPNCKKGACSVPKLKDASQKNLGLPAIDVEHKIQRV